MVISTLQDRRVLSVRDDVGQNGLGDIKAIERGSRETDRGGTAAPRAPRHKPKPKPECVPSDSGEGGASTASHSSPSPPRAH